MKFSSKDIIACINSQDTDGLSEVSFGGPQEAFFEMCRMSRECSLRDGIVETGVMDIYSVINDQSCATNGGIIACKLTDVSFSIEFDGRASLELQEARVDVNLVASRDVLIQLRDALNCIFRDTKLFSDETTL